MEDRGRVLLTGDERVMFNSWLNWHRATLLFKCADLTDAQLREYAVPPSSMSLIGIVRHMAEVERRWFRVNVAHEEIGAIWEDDDKKGFAGVENADVQQALEALRDEIEKSKAIESTVDSWDTKYPHRSHGEVSFRWIMYHMLEEYARHNGHADLLRERIDGKTGS